MIVMEDMNTLKVLKAVFLLSLSFLFAFFFIIETSMSHAAEMQTLVVISNLDGRMHDYDKSLVQGGLFGHNYKILEPRDLNDLAEMLIRRGRQTKIKYLVFFAHGTERFIEFRTPNEKAIFPEDLARIRQEYPLLAKAFAQNAIVEFFACDVGRNPDFLRAASEAFLREYGGMIMAYKKSIEWNDPAKPDRPYSIKNAGPIEYEAEALDCSVKCRNSANPNRCLPLCRAARSGAEGRTIKWLKRNR
jgi:hypothetical protein